MTLAIRVAGAAAALGAAALAAPPPAAAGPAAHGAKVRIAPKAATARPVRGGGAQLRWKTAREQGNVGFVLFRARRATPGKRVRLIKRMVAGSVVKIGTTRVLKAGARYARFDRTGRRGDRYFILDVDVSGKTRTRGPFVVRGKPVKRVPNSPLLKPSKPKPKAPATPTGPPTPVAPPAPTSGPGTPPDQVQQQLASRQTVRLGVDADGWTRVDFATIEFYGVDVSKPQNLHVYTAGREVPVQQRDGGLEFYGRAVDTLDTAARAYFVEAQTGPGLRVATAPAATQAPNGPSAFDTTATRDVRTSYFQGLLNGPASNFFGDVVGSVGVNVTVNTPSVARAEGNTLSVTLQGLTAGDHAISVAFNGTAVGTASLAGRTNSTSTFDVSGVASGANTMRLQSSAAGDIVLTGPVSVRYPHDMNADGDRLALTAPGGQRVRIGGFSGPGARMVDVTDPDAPVLLDGVSDAASVRATAPGDGTRKLYAFAPNAILTPASVATGTPSTLRAADNAGELTIITRASYRDALEPLAAQRRSEGLTVATVTLQDIYDEFSFGQADREAITRFTQYARETWGSPPRYVLLGGDGTYDPRDFQTHSAAGNVVPTALIDAAAEVPSDSTLTGTLATGRLPARSPQEMTSLVAKTLSYQNQPSTGSALLASDINDTWNFTGSSDALKPRLPQAWAVSQIERSQTDARERLLAGLGSGPSVVNWAGHGSVSFWRGNLLKNADAAGLQNRGELSFFVLMTCLNGYFADPTLDALSEALVKAPNGAVAVFSSTGTTTPGPQEPANQALISALFGGPAAPRLGDAVVASLSASGDDDVRRTWTLTGDPTLVIH